MCLTTHLPCLEPAPLPPPEQNIITDRTDQNTATDLLVNTLLTAGTRREQDDVIVLISTLVPLGVLVVGAIMTSVVIAVIVCKCKRKKSTREWSHSLAHLTHSTTHTNMRNAHNIQMITLLVHTYM